MPVTNRIHHERRRFPWKAALTMTAARFGIFDGLRLYQLIRQPRPIVDQTFEIQFLDGALDAFVFTFG
jgi:Thioredoxin like C-terminal domain